MAYLDVTELIADYMPNVTAFNDIAAVTRIAEFASSAVDAYCGRPQGYFSGVGKSPFARGVIRTSQDNEIPNLFLRLPLHVAGTVTDVTDESGGLVPAEYYAESATNGWLYRTGLQGFITDSWEAETLGGGDDSRARRYLVTARWGYEYTPPAITEATRLIVEKIWDRQRGVLGQFNPDQLEIEISIPPLAREILQSFRRRPFEPK